MRARVSRRAAAVTRSDFSRWTLQSAVVLGEYLYIDGGEIGTKDGIFGPREQLASRIVPTVLVQQLINTLCVTHLVKTTVSLPLHSSWTNASVPIRSTGPHPAPLLDHPVLWADEESNCFYQWGGYRYSLDHTAVSDALWKFSADGSGGGSWTKLSAPPDPRMIRTSNGFHTFGDGVGYNLGGVPSVDGNLGTGDLGATPISGMVSYDFSSHTWSFARTGGFSASGAAAWGLAVFAPSFGDRGIILTFGGATSDVHSGQTLTWLPFDDLRVYDVQNRKWFTQATTGVAPTPRARFCVVGVEGRNRTFDVFVYAGFDPVENITFNDLYVLSLPGFVWRKGPSTSDVRGGHTCNVVGKRQMLVVGGLNWGLGVPDDYKQPDPNALGLSILDMTNMEWADHFAADAAPYESPKVIQDWYSQADPSSVTWSSPEVRDLFIDSSSKLYPTNHTSEPTSSPTSSSTSSSTSGSTSGSTSDLSVPGLVGGIIGGIVLLCLVIGLFFVWRKRRRRAHDTAISASDMAQYQGKAELPGNGTSNQQHSSAGQSWRSIPPEDAASYNFPPENNVGTPAELSSVRKPAELPLGVTEPAELDSRVRSSG